MKMLIAFTLIGLMGFTSPEKSPKQEIEALMQKQQDAWNKGDIDGFMASYWKNDSLVFIGSKGLTYGWQPVLNNYKKSYPDKAAMGRLAFNNKIIRELNTTHIWVAGQWTLYRDRDTIGGHYTLVWQKIDGQWVIISDHSS